MATRTAHLALLDTLSDWEIGYLTAHLNGGDLDDRFELRTVGLTAEPVTTMGGLRLTPDLTVEAFDPHDSAILVLPGAETWGEERARPFLTAAAACLGAGTPVAAICGATFGLATAGLLDGRRHTSNARDFLASSGYRGADRYVDEPVVIDGDLVTASGVAPVHFARAVFERLGAYEPARLTSWFKLYGDRDPAGFYELMAG